MRALVTGASGYLGGRLAERLLDDGHDVHLLLRPGSSLDPSGPLVARATVHRSSGRREEVDAAVRDSSPDIVFHLASKFLVEHGPADVEPLVLSNILFGAQLVDALVAHGTRRLVVASTAWRRSGGPGGEPVNLYAATKEAFRALLSYWVPAAGLRCVSLDLLDTYGPRDPRPKLVPTLLRLARTGGSEAFSPGHQLIDLVHVDDVVEAFVVAGRRTGDAPAACFESFAVSSGHSLPLREIVRSFEEELGRPLPIRWGERPCRTREVLAPRSDCPPLPGWRPCKTLPEGIRELIAGLRPS